MPSPTVPTTVDAATDAPFPVSVGVEPAARAAFDEALLGPLAPSYCPVPNRPVVPMRRISAPFTTPSPLKSPSDQRDAAPVLNLPRVPIWRISLPSTCP